MYKNIVNLTRILCKDLLSKLDFINVHNRKIDKKKSTFWFLVTIIIAIAFLSYKVIIFFRDINQQIIFLNLFFMMLSIITIFQIIIISLNNYYFSHELNYLLPLPIKPKELLISKFLTILINIYISESLFFLIPMLLYGILTYCNCIYYIYLIVIFAIFPILPILIISILMSIFIKFSVFVKNKNIFQIIITMICILGMFFIVSKLSNLFMTENNGYLNNDQIVNVIIDFNRKLENGNKYLIQVNDIVKSLYRQKSSNFWGLAKITIINFILFIIFIKWEEKFYIKDILNNNSFNKLKKRVKTKNIKIPQMTNKKISYFYKEIKMIFRNPVYFVQYVFPSIILIFTIILLSVKFILPIREFIDWKMLEEKITISYNLKMAGIILIIAQIMFSISTVSITGISRDGKDAKFMKVFPIGFYDQFIIKSSVQTIMNNILSIIFMFFLHKVFPEIPWLDVLFLFVLVVLLNTMNSRLMLFIDLIKPNLNWDSEYEMNQNQKNKIFQYVFSIGMICFISYLAKVLYEFNIIMSYLIIIDIFMLLIFIINFVVKLNITKLFNKIK